MAVPQKVALSDMQGLTIPNSVWVDRKLDCISKVIASYIMEHGDSFNSDDIAELSEYLGLTKVMVTRRINRLRADGYLKRLQ